MGTILISVYMARKFKCDQLNRHDGISYSSAEVVEGHGEIRGILVVILTQMSALEL